MSAQPDPGCPSTTRHGTPTAIRWDHCRCPNAIAAANRAAKTRYLNRSRHGPRLINPAGARRRIQALAAIGWSQTAQAQRLGITLARVNYIANPGRRGAGRLINVRTRDRIVAMYTALADATPPPGPGTARSIRGAEAAGYLPPIAWDDNIDDPAALPYEELRADGTVMSAWRRCLNAECLRYVTGHNHWYCGPGCRDTGQALARQRRRVVDAAYNARRRGTPRRRVAA